MWQSRLSHLVLHGCSALQGRFLFPGPPACGSFCGSLPYEATGPVHSTSFTQLSSILFLGATLIAASASCGSSDSSSVSGDGTGGTGGSAGSQASGGSGQGGSQAGSTSQGGSSSGQGGSSSGQGGSGGETAFCNNSLDCAGNTLSGRTICDTNRGVCVECVSTPDCEVGDLCVSFSCGSPCASDLDCTPDGKLCDFASGVCVVPGGQGGSGQGGSGQGGSGQGGSSQGGSAQGGSSQGGSSQGGSGQGGSGGSSQGGTSSGGSGGSGGSMGSCNPAFCPNPGVGTPCCITNTGPCGVDVGMGCAPIAGD